MPGNGESNGQAKLMPAALIAHQWKPGQSGNSSGRPKHAVISKETRRGIEELDPETGQIRAREVFLAMYKEALKGNVQAAIWLRETCEGKLAETFRGSIDVDPNGLMRAESDAKQKLAAKLGLLLDQRTAVTVTQTETVVTAHPLPQLPIEPPTITIGSNHLPLRPATSERANLLRQRFKETTT